MPLAAQAVVPGVIGVAKPVESEQFPIVDKPEDASFVVPDVAEFSAVPHDQELIENTLRLVRDVLYVARAFLGRGGY